MPSTPVEVAARWRELREEIMAGIEEWRLPHPQATGQESEAAVEARLAELRARMVPDVALASQAADVRHACGPDRPLCPPCGSPVAPRGPRAAGDDPAGENPAAPAELCEVPDLSGRVFPPG
jgi:hypothetical protein